VPVSTLKQMLADDSSFTATTSCAG
jgi:hypothetical protein